MVDAKDLINQAIENNKMLSQIISKMVFAFADINDYCIKMTKATLDVTNDTQIMKEGIKDLSIMIIDRIKIVQQEADELKKNIKELSDGNQRNERKTY